MSNPERFRRLSRERMAAANVDGHNDMDPQDAERESEIRNRNEILLRKKNEKEEKRKRKREEEEIKHITEKSKKASYFLRDARSKKKEKI